MDPLFFHPSYFKDLKRIMEKWAKFHNGLVTTIGKLCVKDGVLRPKARLTSEIGDIPRLGVENVTGMGLLWDCKHVEVAPDQSRLFLVQNDILISSTGTGSTGRVDIFVESVPAITDGHITVLRINKDIVDPFFVFSFLKTEYAKRQLLRMERGSSGQIELYPDDIANLLVPLPEDKSVRKQASKLVKKSTMEIREAKVILRDARSKISENIGELESSRSEQTSYAEVENMVTAIPRAKWRIIRP